MSIDTDGKKAFRVCLPERGVWTGRVRSVNTPWPAGIVREPGIHARQIRVRLSHDGGRAGGADELPLARTQQTRDVQSQPES